MSNPFEGKLEITVTAEVTHPPGTTFDEHGMPIPPPEDSPEEESRPVPVEHPESAVVPGKWAKVNGQWRKVQE